MGWKTTVEKTGIDATAVYLSALRGRLDPEYFSLGTLGLVEKLKKKETKSLNNYCSITASAFYPAATDLYSIGDVPFARATDCINQPVITSGQIGEFEKIPEEFLLKNRNIRTIFDGDIIITKVGTPCYASIVDGVGRVALSRTVLGLKNITNIDAYYLLAFLRSKYGFNQLQRERELTIQYQLTLERTGSIKIAAPSNKLQAAIANIVKKHSNLSEKSKIGFYNAKKILDEYLNLAAYKKTEKTISVRKYSVCNSVNRFDAEYWLPEYDEIEKRVSMVNQQELGDITTYKKGIEPGSEAYSEEGKLFLRVSDFSIYGFDVGEKRISEELYNELKEEYQPEKEEVLFTKDGTIGISFALHENIEGILSGAFLRLRPIKKINIDYLALVLNSEYCRAQIKRMSGGAIISHLKPENVRKIKIPILSDNKQEKLADLVNSSLKLRKEAKVLFERAKRAVELFVEKDEKEALEYLT